MRILGINMPDDEGGEDEEEEDEGSEDEEEEEDLQARDDLDEEEEVPESTQQPHTTKIEAATAQSGSGQAAQAAVNTKAVGILQLLNRPVAAAATPQECAPGLLQLQDIGQTPPGRAKKRDHEQLSSAANDVGGSTRWKAMKLEQRPSSSVPIPQAQHRGAVQAAGVKVPRVEERALVPHGYGFPARSALENNVCICKCCKCDNEDS